jgi:hypothetical protein
MPALTVTGQVPGSKLWVRLWDYNGNNEGNFSACAIGNYPVIPCTSDGDCPTGFECSGGFCQVTPTTADCKGATPLCSDATVSGFAAGQGNYADLNPLNDGCLSGEHNSSWFFIQVSTAGSWGFIADFPPTDNFIEYDFALWGPFTNNPTDPGSSVCNGLGSPIRCSFASQSGKSDNSVGMVSTEPTTEFVEGVSPSGNGLVYWLPNVNPGEIYILLLDRWSSFGSPYTMDFLGTATMDCAILPIELLSFTGTRQERTNLLTWVTASETDNHYFTIESSDDMQNWDVVGVVQGAGTTSEQKTYSLVG